MHFHCNGTYPTFAVLVHFWAQFTTGKYNKMTKNQIFPKSYILRTIRQHKVEVRAKKTPFWAKNGHKLPTGAESKFSHSLSQDHLFKVSRYEVSASGCLPSLTLPQKIQLLFLVQGTIRPSFVFFVELEGGQGLGNNSKWLD